MSIVDRGKYYLYRHIRLDKDEPFYIGMATKRQGYQNCNTFRKEYGRSFTKYKRNLFWRRIVNKTEYKVEILMESDSLSFIRQKEIEFIKLYGRRDLGLGPLVNLTDGGESTVGLKHTEKWLKAASERMKIRMSDRNNMSFLTKVYQYDRQGKFLKEWQSKIDACRYYCIPPTTMGNCLDKTDLMADDYFWMREFKGDKISVSDNVRTRAWFVPIIMYNKNNDDELLEFYSMQEIREFLKETYPKAASGHIHSCCKGTKPSIYGYKWKYKKL